MTVKKKSLPPKKMSKKEQAEFSKRTSDAIQGKPKTKDSRLDRILNNDFVRVETTGVPFRLEKDPISAINTVEGLMEYQVEGTVHRLLGLVDANATPTVEQRVAMAKRLNEVGPKLPRYIKKVFLKPATFHSVNDPGNSDHAASVARSEQTEGRAPGVARAKKQQSERVPKTTIPGGVPLKKICGEIDLDPKLARRILRSKGKKPGGRWEWKPEEVEEIKALLVAGAKEIAK